MTIERRPVAFGDMRGWMKALKAAGELHEIDSEVDWNIELGTITRMAQGPGTGPALLFSNIKDYNNSNSSRCGAVFAGGLASYRRVAMMLGLPPDTHPRKIAIPRKWCVWSCRFHRGVARTSRPARLRRS